MTSETESISPNKRGVNLCPWLAAIGALILYIVTLNHFVTLESLPVVAQITGWDWHPNPLPWRAFPIMPLWTLVTFPFRILPAGWQPAALNAFSALCAALTLGALAKSVRLLPQDRTRDQRERGTAELSLLTVRCAFLPPLFAILMLGLQSTFWENAVAATGETLDVLVFAVLILCLLQFRNSKDDKWLTRFALLYGIGSVNNWALYSFSWFFLVAIIWLKGLGFFNWRFILRMTGWGFLGLMLYFLLPVAIWLRPNGGNFWPVLHQELSQQWFMLKHMPRWFAAVTGLPLALALIIMSVRWPDFEGDLSVQSNLLTKFTFRVLHVVFFCVTLCMFYEFKYSPSPRSMGAPTSFLTFYYIAAICVGYFSGDALWYMGSVQRFSETARAH